MRNGAYGFADGGYLRKLAEQHGLTYELHPSSSGDVHKGFFRPIPAELMGE